MYVYLCIYKLCIFIYTYIHTFTHTIAHRKDSLTQSSSVSAGKKIQNYKKPMENYLEHHFGKQFCQFLINLNKHLFCSPALAVLGIYPKEMETYIYKKTCT